MFPTVFGFAAVCFCCCLLLTAAAAVLTFEEVAHQGKVEVELEAEPHGVVHLLEVPLLQGLAHFHQDRLGTLWQGLDQGPEAQWHTSLTGQGHVLSVTRSEPITAFLQSQLSLGQFHRASKHRNLPSPKTHFAQQKQVTRQNPMRYALRRPGSQLTVSRYENLLGKIPC